MFQAEFAGSVLLLLIFLFRFVTVTLFSIYISAHHAYVQILPTLNLSDITSETRVVTMRVIAN